jgi:hypothetical protein
MHEEPRRDYANTVAEIEKLDAMVRARGATLVVLALRDDMRDDGAWTDLIAKLDDVTARRGIPMLDIGPGVFGARSDQELRVHEVDDHPNEVAHALIADELLRFLDEHGLLRRHRPSD